jgi:hypothetical protein
MEELDKPMRNSKGLYMTDLVNHQINLKELHMDSLKKKKSIMKDVVNNFQ